MLRFIRLIIYAIFSFAPLASAAQDAQLRRLDTIDDNRGWEAVGRLDVDGRGFCTGALIAPNLVLTAAHCLFDTDSKARIDHEKIEFLAGWRNGRATAYRWIKRAVVHPEYVYDGEVGAERVRNDVALLELHHPIRNTTVRPFDTNTRPREGAAVGVVSYARGRSDAPSLQEICHVMARQQGALVMSCDVDFGSSGAPIFSFVGGEPQIVSVVSAKATVNGQQVALGTQLEVPLEILRAELAAGNGYGSTAAGRVVAGSARRADGAKFIKP
ncbi:trypsin [Litorivita pollutaquae]|uniref:Trypsin n=1 Tax=Litorivita pollutaquae TaxID=2200892 RepID=A0A2V4MZU7_9RHOB|nr:trypsin-like serine protease [Litorivita pollutaquae]PYC47212.1 trypsin [Litorivita pollutaquae]